MDCLSVITGDIVKSSTLTDGKRKILYETFPVLSGLLKSQYPEQIPYNISNFRGDGWQLIVNQPEKSLEIGLFIRTYIRFKFKEEKLDTRFAIGVGSVNFIPEENVSAGDGPAYMISGHLLESLVNKRIDIGFEAVDPSLESTGIRNVVILIDYIVSSWNSSLSQAIFWALHRYRQTEIAKNWYPRPITQATVSSNLKSAGWEQIQFSLDYFEKAIQSHKRKCPGN